MEWLEFIRSDSHSCTWQGARVERSMRLLPHQQRSVCMWGCSSDTDGVTEPSTGLWSRAGGQGRTELPLSRRRPPSLLITRCPAPSLLPFLVLGGSKGNSRLFFFFFFPITFSLTCVSKPSDREEKCWLWTLVRVLPRWMQLGGGGPASVVNARLTLWLKL